MRPAIVRGVRGVVWAFVVAWGSAPAITLAVVPLALVGGCPMETMPADGLPDFDSAEVVPGAAAGTFELVVRGYSGVCEELSLQPLVYIQQPEYWGYQLISHATAEVCTRQAVRFEVRAALNSVGTKGVEVIGATKTQALAVP